jgi:hypothetical protein
MTVQSTARRLIGRILPLFVLVGVGLALGACTKCDVPNWARRTSSAAPLMCHDAPQPQ